MIDKLKLLTLISTKAPQILGAFKNMDTNTLNFDTGASIPTKDVLSSVIDRGYDMNLLNDRLSKEDYADNVLSDLAGDLDDIKTFPSDSFIQDTVDITPAKKSAYALFDYLKGIK